ncbi:MAG: hypothetical protein V7782_14120 [Psychromonas sp.]
MEQSSQSSSAHDTSLRDIRPTITWFECHCVATSLFPMLEWSSAKRLNEKIPADVSQQGFIVY